MSTDDQDNPLTSPRTPNPPAWPPTNWSTGAKWLAEPAPSPSAQAPIAADWSAPTPGTNPPARDGSPDWGFEQPVRPPVAEAPDPKGATSAHTADVASAAPASRPPSKARSGIRTILAAGILSATLASLGTTAIVGGLGGATPPTAAPPATANAAVTGTRTTTATDLTGMVATARESVVTITADGLSVQGLSPFSVPTTGVGSGIILTANGYILTNRHVIAGSSSLSVALPDGTEYPATLVKESTTTDLALIKIDATGLTAATIGDSSKIQVGQTAIAIGSPLGTFTETVTQGIISGLGRTITVRDDQTGRPTTLSDLIQTDAAINPGNSGGPLLDASGAVVGVDTAVAGSAQGIGFAIPISAASDLIDLARASAT
jgi:serine protease Do